MLESPLESLSYIALGQALEALEADPVGEAWHACQACAYIGTEEDTRRDYTYRAFLETQASHR